MRSFCSSCGEDSLANTNSGAEVLACKNLQFQEWQMDNGGAIPRLVRVPDRLAKKINRAILMKETALRRRLSPSIIVESRNFRKSQRSHCQFKSYLIDNLWQIWVVTDEVHDSGCWWSSNVINFVTKNNIEIQLRIKGAVGMKLIDEKTVKGEVVILGQPAEKAQRLRWGQRIHTGTKQEVASSRRWRVKAGGDKI